MGGFKVPILHGLCSFGIAGKAVYQKYVALSAIHFLPLPPPFPLDSNSILDHPISPSKTILTKIPSNPRYGPYRNIKVRFAGTVLPGQTLVTEMWKEGKNKVIFQTKVRETGKLAIASAAVELLGDEGEKAKI